MFNHLPIRLHESCCSKHAFQTSLCLPAYGTSCTFLQLYDTCIPEFLKSPSNDHNGCQENDEDMKKSV